MHYATSSQRPLATALAAVRARRSLDEIDGWLPAVGARAPAQPGGAAAPLRALARRGRAHRRHRAERARSTCASPRPNLPDLDVPARPHRHVVAARADPAGRGAALPRVTHPDHEQAQHQLEYELGVIEQLGFPGYFLLLFDIVELLQSRRHLLPGAGSAANSAVCYALGVTKADAVALGLLFSFRDVGANPVCEL